jgi:SNF2 family DNA or RNA helicase
LVQNWAKEFDKFLGKASQPKRVVVTRGGDVGIPKLKAFCPIKPQMSEVLIVSYDLFRIHASLLTKAQQIGILVVDEGHRLKNSAGSLTCDALSQLDSASRLLISGTPLQNNLCEFYTLGDFVIPGVLGDLNDFRKDFERPITAASAKGASREEKLLGEQQSQALEKICKTFMIRRLAKDVLAKMLPPRREVLLFCRPSELQCQLYREVTEQAPADPLLTLTSLRKLCSHPNLLNENSSPMIESSGKLVILGKLLHKICETSPTDKVVLVSCFTSTLTLIQDMLIRPNGWTFTRLDGTTAQTDRQPLVDAFNRTSAQKSYIFLLSSKAGGVGLNLVGANRLVMFDADYNPAIDAQAMARIYRPGQTKPCFIYRFFTSGTTEEVVYQRQLKKSNLATMTVDRSESDFNRFSRDELRDCFTLKHCACDTMTKLSWPNEPTNLTDDAALIALTKDKWLGYVHVVPSEVPQNIVEDDGQGGDNEIHKDDEEEEEVGDDEPSEEEFEFDG